MHNKLTTVIYSAYKNQKNEIWLSLVIGDSSRYTISLNAFLLFKAFDSKSFLNRDTQIAADLA